MAEPLRPSDLRVLALGGHEAHAVALVRERRAVVHPAAVLALRLVGRQRAPVLGAAGLGRAAVARVQDTVVVVVGVARVALEVTVVVLLVGVRDRLAVVPGVVRDTVAVGIRAAISGDLRAGGRARALVGAVQHAVVI